MKLHLKYALTQTLNDFSIILHTWPILLKVLIDFFWKNLSDNLNFKQAYTLISKGLASD